ncbi:Universal stress protein/MSMEI_3859 [Phycisphaerales bacterium]|nr:Universal stress protein/MSMEI_3859 [Phycisphaerales bacterium]
MRILIAYDGSECARAALTDLRLAGLPSDADVLVLSVLDAWLPKEDGPGGKSDEALPGLKDIRASVRAAVERQRGIAEDGAARLRTLFPGWSIKAEACADSPAWAIIKRTEGHEGGVAEKPADFVVVGSHGYSGLLGGVKRLVLGSVSHRVVTELRPPSPCSVRIARGRDRTTPARSDVPKIVVGVDGSADSRAAVHAVASRRWPQGTRILLATFEQSIYAGTDVGVMGAYTVWGGDPVGGVGSDTPSSDVTSGTRIVAEAAATLRRLCPQVSVSTVVKPGDPKYALIDLADDWEEDGVKGADCIFVGARGVRGVERFLLGSVSTAVAMNADCSVEIVHPRRGPASTPA